MASMLFKRGGFYSDSDKTTNIFKDPQFAFKNLISCLFFGKWQEPLVDKAVNLLEVAKINGIQTTNYWKKGDQTPKQIGNMTYTFSNYQTIIKHFKAAGILEGKKGENYKLSTKFCYYLESASDCYRNWYRSK